MSKGTIVTFVFLAFVGYLSFTMIWSGNTVQCDICIKYKGKEVCQTVKGMDKENTVMTGISTACGGAANGMTESIECQNTLPTKLVCKNI